MQKCVWSRVGLVGREREGVLGGCEGCERVFLLMSWRIIAQA